MLILLAIIFQISIADKVCDAVDEVSFLQHTAQLVKDSQGRGRANKTRSESNYYRHLQESHAQMHKQPIEDAILDGGGEPWPLFQFDQAPLELANQNRSEAFVPADPNDPIGARCCPDDTQGFWYYNVSNPTLVPFILPNDYPGRVDAAVIVIPGGGNSFLAWNKEGTRVAKWLNSIGFSAFVLKYRVPCDNNLTRVKSLIDGQRAVSLVRHRAPEFGLNVSRIGLIGFSAGGGISADVSYTLDRAYGPLDEVDASSHRPDFVLLIYAGGDPTQAKNAPPTFLALAQDDQCVFSVWAEAYYMSLSALSMSDNRHDEMHVFAEGRHGYGDCTLYVEGGKWLDVCAWTANAALFLQTQILNIHPGLADNATGMLFTRGQMPSLTLG